MHSGSSEKAVSSSSSSLRKRILSRGMSEDESLRHIRREAEGTNRYLSRNDTRCGSLKPGHKEESLGKEDLLTDKIEMVELQADYELCLQEMRALELQQETLLFQVDCLQDALEGAEEMLYEAQREAHAVNMELEREREARTKLEDVVSSLRQEMEVLKEKGNSVIPVNIVMDDQAVGISSIFSESPVDGDVTPGGKSTASQYPVWAEEPSSSREPLGFKSGHIEPFLGRHAGPIWLQGAPEGTSVDQEASLILNTESCQVNLNTSPTLQLDHTVHQKRQAHGDDNDESSGYEDAPSEFSPTPSTPDEQPDGDLLEDDVNAASRDSKSVDSCTLS